MKNIQIRKTLALASAAAVLFTLVWSLIKGDREIAIMCLGTLIGCIQWYFSKSTALEQPKNPNT